MNFIIREAEKNDWPFIVSLLESRGRKSGTVLSGKYECEFERITNRENKKIYVGEADGKIISTISIDIIISLADNLMPVGNIGDFAVKDNDEEISIMMLNKAQEYALKKGCRRIFVSDRFVNAERNKVYLRFGLNEGLAVSYIKCFPGM